MSSVQVYKEGYEQLTRIDWDFPDAKQDALASIHPYPARFIPQIPEALLVSLDCPKSATVLDPFCGSGTTLTVAQRLGYKSIGIDLNPIACLISRVKTQPLPKSLDKDITIVCDEALRLYMESSRIPSIPNLDHWFKKDIQMAISAIVISIERYADVESRDALKLALSSIIVRVSNQESDTRYAAIEKNNTADDVFRLFAIAAKRLYATKLDNSANINSEIIQSDILTVKSTDIKDEIGIVITSPPYPNAYEYWLYHKYRMWWLGYDPIAVREHEIGARPHYQKKNGQTEVDFYEQMKYVFGLINSRLIENGYLCIVVGRSIISGRVIDNNALMRSIGAESSLTLVADISRDIAATRKSFNLKYGRIKKESILVFQKESQ